MSRSRFGAFGWLAGRWLRRRLLGVLPILLIVAIGGTATALAFGAATRTSSAYGDYLDRANVGDVVVNPSVTTTEIDQLLRSLPGVRRVTTSAMFEVTADDGAPRPRGEIELPEPTEPPVTVLGSPDGRFTDMDRPAVEDGRLPTGPSEAVVTVEAAEHLDVSVGDVVPLAFWSPIVIEGLDEGAVAALFDEIIAPIGVEQVEIVGIVTMADEVLPDGLYPRLRMILSEDIAARYVCRPGRLPPPHASREEALALIFSTSCASTYQYYSLAIEGGAGAVDRALDAFVGAAAELNRQLADVDAVWKEEGLSFQFFLIPTVTETQRRAVDHAIGPSVAGLLALGATAAAVTVTLAGLVAVRELRRTRRDQLLWYQLGARSVERAVVAVPLVAAAVTGFLLAVAAAWVLNTGPVGLVRAIEPRPDRSLPAAMVAATAATTFACLCVIAALVLVEVRRGPNAESIGERQRVGRVPAVRTAPPAVADGLSGVFAHRSTRPAVAGLAVLTAAFVASSVYASSLSSLLSTPAAYGWRWDVAAITGAGYGDLDLRGAHDAFDDDPAIDDWMVAGFINDVAIDGAPMAALVGLDRTTGVSLTVKSGELPTGDREVAIGSTTADELDVNIGDTVDIGGSIEPRTATVSGIVVFPALGPFLAERVGTGSGLLLPEAMLDDDMIREFATFVGIELADGWDSPAVRQRLGEQLNAVDTESGLAAVYQDAVEPPEIVDADSVRGLPRAVAVLIAATGAVGLLLVSWASTRARRRDVAVLRALGFVGQQIRLSVRVQALSTVALAMLLGVPTGVIAGRALWQAFAERLGVVPDAASPWLTIVVTAVGGGLIALGASAVPAQLASRASPAAALRAD